MTSHSPAGTDAVGMDSVPAAVAAPQHDLAHQFARVRARSMQLAGPLSAEDAMLQSMADASPSKWHLAHTTWFFERFVLAGFPPAPAHDPAWDYLFNSYYKSIGPAHARPQRGLLSRPSLQQVHDYRQQVDAQVQSRLSAGDLDPHALHNLQLGLQHEQQHQELLLTDIKHAFWCNPLQPAYREDLQPATSPASAQGWIESPERIVTIGAAAWPQHTAFAYDNGVVLDTVLAQHEEDNLSRLHFQGGALFVGRRGEAIGSRLRCRIHARDVSLALERPQRSSIVNLLPAVVTATAATETPGHVLVQLRMGEVALLARISERSRRELDIRPGIPVWAQIKAVALLG